MSALAFPAAVLATWSILGLAIGYGMRRLLGQNRALLTLVLLGLLAPWIRHHLEITRQASAALSQALGPETELPISAVTVGPVIVLLVVTIAVLIAGRLRFLVVAVPAAAFLVTYNLTFRLVYGAVPGFHFDNIPNIWLFMWTVGATILLITYWRPILPTDLRKFD